jgi:hypothetical protein
VYAGEWGLSICTKKLRKVRGKNLCFLLFVAPFRKSPTVTLYPF